MIIFKQKTLFILERVRLIHDELSDELSEAGAGDTLLPPLPPLPQPGLLCFQLCLSGQQQNQKYER